jgi:hypothetical protein
LAKGQSEIRAVRLIGRGLVTSAARVAPETIKKFAEYIEMIKPAMSFEPAQLGYGIDRFH